jgi:hypothetical protein
MKKMKCCGYCPRVLSDDSLACFTGEVVFLVATDIYKDAA